MKHFKEEELIAYRDGEGKGRAEIDAHLKECDVCRTEMERIEEVYAALDAMPVPDPGEDYGQRVWRQIAPRLPDRQARWWEGFFSPGRLAAVGAVAALLVVAFVLGRMTKRSVPGAEVADESKVRERVLVVAVGEHLGRSEMVLMELANAQPGNKDDKAIDISAEQKRAEDLVEENRLYRQTAWSEGDTAMTSTLDELERALLDIANSPDEVTPAQFESLRKRIEARGLLLKVRVVQQELHNRQGSASGVGTGSSEKDRSKI